VIREQKASGKSVKIASAGIVNLPHCLVPFS